MKNLNHPSDTLPIDYFSQTGLPLCLRGVFCMTKNVIKKKYRGAHYIESRNNWMSCIGVDDKQVFLGYFKTDIEAAIAYDLAVRKYYPNSGKRLNFPTDLEPEITIPNTRWIRLTRGLFTLVDEDCYDLLMKYNWYANKPCNTFYALKSPKENSIGGINNATKMHQVVLEVYDGTFIDHINHNGLDNRKCNLRVCSHSENMANIKSIAKSTSIYKGVSYYKSRNKWIAYIRFNKKLIHLGYFDNENDAAIAYNIAAPKYFKEFSYLNVIIN